MVIAQNELWDEAKILEFKLSFEKTVCDVFLRHGHDLLSILHSDSIIILVPEFQNNYEYISKLADEIRKDISVKFRGLTACVGIGNRYGDLKKMKNSFKEAEQALKVAKLNGTKNTTCFFHSLGIYRILLKVEDREELEVIFRETLGRILQHDRLNGSSLLKTLESLMETNGSMQMAAERLYIHRNTLTYRLQKIQDITSFHLEDANDCFNIRLAIQIGRFLGFTW